MSGFFILVYGFLLMVSWFLLMVNVLSAYALTFLVFWCIIYIIW